MKNTMKLIQEKISSISEVAYCDEDWGQLDFYGSQAPVKWPCVLIDLQNGTFSNIGSGLQNGDMQLTLSIADVKLTPTSSKVPNTMKAKQWNILELEQTIHKIIHGWTPDVSICGKLTRIASTKVKRDDGVTQRIVTYSFTIYGI